MDDPSLYRNVAAMALGLAAAFGAASEAAELEPEGGNVIVVSKTQV